MQERERNKWEDSNSYFVFLPYILRSHVLADTIYLRELSNTSEISVVENRRFSGILNVDMSNLANVKQNTRKCDTVRSSPEGKPDVTAKPLVSQISENVFGLRTLWCKLLLFPNVLSCSLTPKVPKAIPQSHEQRSHRLFDTSSIAHLMVIKLKRWFLYSLKLDHFDYLKKGRLFL